MKSRRLFFIKLLIAAFVASGCGVSLPSCGSTRAYWGVHNEYELSDGGHNHHRKPPKPKKHKKKKKHKKHHHDDD